MTSKRCPNGHTFEKTSDCPTCSICAKMELTAAYKAGFPRIGSPAYFGLQNAGIGLADLPNYSKEQLLAVHGVGPRAVGMLKEYLRNK